MNNLFATEVEAKEKLNELFKSTGEYYIIVATDERSVHNEYKVVRMPHVGDDVSMGFNGDYYPCGKISKISKTYFKITTDTGTTFTRVGPSCWKHGGKDGTFSLINGTIDERNPSF